MLLFDATHRSMRPVVAQLQQAGRSGRGAALYSECLAALEQARAMGDDAALVLIAQTFGLVIDQDGYSDVSIAWLQEAVECAKRCGEFGEQSHLLYLVGRAYYSRAEYGVALGYWTSVTESLRSGRSLADELASGAGGRNLLKLGYHADIEFCSRIDHVPQLPELDLLAWEIRLR